jgi:hypothetical protein
MRVNVSRSPFTTIALCYHCTFKNPLAPSLMAPEIGSAMTPVMPWNMPLPKSRIPFANPCAAWLCVSRADSSSLARYTIAKRQRAQHTGYENINYQSFSARQQHHT